MNFTTKQKALLLISIPLVLFLVSCAGQKAMWGDEKSGFILSYRTDGGTTWKYQYNADQMMSMEMQGRSMETTSQINLEYTISDIQSENDNLKAMVTIDELETSVQNSQGERKLDLSSLIGKRFGLTFTPRGNILKRTGLDTLKINLGPMQGGEVSAKNFFRNLLTKLPEKPVRIGDTWVTPLDETVQQSGMDIQTRGTIKNTVLALETVNGFECLKIKSETKATLDGEGEQMGTPIVYEGDMSSTGTWYFAYKKGFLVKMEQTMLVEGTIAVTGAANMTMPMTQETKSTLTLISAK